MTTTTNSSTSLTVAEMASLHATLLRAQHFPRSERPVRGLRLVAVGPDTRWEQLELLGDDDGVAPTSGYVLASAATISARRADRVYVSDWTRRHTWHEADQHLLSLIAAAELFGIREVTR